MNQDHTIIRDHIDIETWRHRVCALTGAVAVAFLLGLPASAADRIPSPTAQEILIKTSLLTLNDAIVSGDYTVLHTKLAKPFREQFDPDRLKQTFKSFADQKIDMAAISAARPVATDDARIDDRGVLLLRGRFDVDRSRLAYALDFLPSEGELKPIGPHVSVKPVNATGM